MRPPGPGRYQASGLSTSEFWPESRNTMRVPPTSHLPLISSAVRQLCGNYAILLWPSKEKWDAIPPIIISTKAQGAKHPLREISAQSPAFLRNSRHIYGPCPDVVYQDQVRRTEDRLWVLL